MITIHSCIDGFSRKVIWLKTFILIMILLLSVGFIWMLSKNIPDILLDCDVTVVQKTFWFQLFNPFYRTNAAILKLL